MKVNIYPILTREAEERFNEFWMKAKIDGVVTNQAYDSIFRLAEAQAGLDLSSEVNDEIATQTIDRIVSCTIISHNVIIKNRDEQLWER